MVYVKSDLEKTRARDPYVVLQFVPNKNEVLAQKVRHENNRSNVIRIQIQNLYKVDPEDTSVIEMPETEDQKKVTEAPTRQNDQICRFCSNMKKAKVYHDYNTCQFYRQVKPTKHASRKIRRTESESDSETDAQ